MRCARLDILVKELIRHKINVDGIQGEIQSFSPRKVTSHEKMAEQCSKEEEHSIWSVCICVHVCNYILIAIALENVVRPIITYHTLFQSIQNDNYIGQIHHWKYRFRVHRGSEHMGHSLKHTRQCYNFMQ